jgi:hypothetical protein
MTWTSDQENFSALHATVVCALQTKIRVSNRSPKASQERSNSIALLARSDTPAARLEPLQRPHRQNSVQGRLRFAFHDSQITSYEPPHSNRDTAIRISRNTNKTKTCVRRGGSVFLFRIAGSSPKPGAVAIRISNRKSGIRIPPKRCKINEVQISNRK